MKFLFGKAVPKAVHGHSLARSSFLPLRSLAAVSSKVSYADFSIVAFAGFADAALVRMFGAFVLAARHKWPIRSFTGDSFTQTKPYFRIIERGYFLTAPFLKI